MTRSMVVFPILAACSRMQVAEQVTEDEMTLSLSDEYRFSPATPEMVVAARTGDPAKMAAAILPAAACHAPNSCQPLFPSCTSWSSFTSCGGSFCTSGCVRLAKCLQIDPDSCEFSQKFGQTSESFRVCFDAAQNSCTEWRTQTAVSGCGCGGFES